MRTRLLLLLGFGLATIGGTLFGLHELSARAWEMRRAKLLALAEPGPAARRPWELAFEALLARVDGERFRTLLDSAHRPHVAFGNDLPRALAPEERLWIEAGWSELDGLERVLDEVSRLDPARANWGGEVVKLGALREVTNVLVGHAWLALEEGDPARAAATYARTLALLDACDEGTSFAIQLRLACEATVLTGVRSALVHGLEPRLAKVELAPWLARMAYDPADAERRIRRDLTYLEREPTSEAWDGPADALGYFKPVERALELARLSAPETPWAKLPIVLAGTPAASPFEDDFERQWNLGTRALHQRAARARVAEVALGVAAFRAETGRWPTALAELELEPEQGLDTLTAEPLPYWRDEQEARVGPAAWGERVEPWPYPEESPYLWSLSTRADAPQAPPTRSNSG